MKITDKMRLDWLEDAPLATFIIGGRIGAGKEPVIGCKTIRQAVDAAIKQETKSRALKGEKLKGGA